MRAVHLFVLLGAAPLAACGSASPSVVAQVQAIQRNCGYTRTETTYMGDTKTGSSTSNIKKDCSEDPEFRKIKLGTSDMRLSGEADVFLRYQMPGDEYAHSAHVVIPASDDLFYSLQVGQDLRVRIDPTDSDKAYL